MNLELIEKKIMIPLNARREVWANTLKELKEKEPENEILIKHYQWCLEDLNILEQYYIEEFEIFRKYEER